LATKRKNTKKETETPSEEKILISEKEVWDVLQFANNIYSGVYPSIWTPDLTNSRFKDVTLQPVAATLDKINTALADPKQNEEVLTSYSQWLELNSIMYRRVLLYYSGLLSFDWNYVCTNIKDEKEYRSKKYKADLEIVKDFFDKFNVKDSFSTALKEMLRNETFFGVLRDEGEKYVIQELQRTYCKLTGRFDYGLLYSFNMNVFLQGGMNIDMFPKVFKRFYRDAFVKGNPITYNPSLPVGSRDSSYVYWVDTDPKDGFVALKLFPEIGTNISFLAAFMPDAVIQSFVRSLQLDVNIAKASKILAGEVPFLDAKAKVKDAIAISPDLLGKFMALIKSSLPSMIKVASAPLQNLSAVEFNGDSNMYDSYLMSSSAASGINSRLIYAKDRQNILETKLSMDIDQNILRPVYQQFANILEYWVNQRTKQYKFKFIFEGFNTAIDREERLNTVFKYADTGIILEQKFASAIGLSPFDFRRMMEESKSNDFVNKLTPILKANQMSSKDAGAGRPAKSDKDLTEGGSEARESGSNDEKGEE
jgi:hypothetical protein